MPESGAVASETARVECGGHPTLLVALSRAVVVQLP